MLSFLLLPFYYLFVTPIGLLSRVAADPLSRRWKRNADTYWIRVVPPRARRVAHGDM
ncbi:hypothetical protein; putative signal peptide [Frankia alni ACN14a]|uniref:Uncharacterized protein n=1 Tax=Frankia alni (strain DSM 45986 / CECT 9034 / ACN14a) TaxID=326424 RepID=Q0RGQ5_FRAAA|nr:hypothetical protein; putative signal peptide [Frankia alni ACN14a]